MINKSTVKEFFVPGIEFNVLVTKTLNHKCIVLEKKRTQLSYLHIIKKLYIKFIRFQTNQQASNSLTLILYSSKQKHISVAARRRCMYTKLRRHWLLYLCMFPLLKSRWVINTASSNHKHRFLLMLAYRERHFDNVFFLLNSSRVHIRKRNHCL